MKTLSASKTFVAACTIAACFSAGAASNQQPNAANIALPAQSIAKGIYLQDALSQISLRSGIDFRIGTDISSDKVLHAVSADNWPNAVKALLAGYNWVAIQDGHTLKTVIITGKNGDSAPASSGVKPKNPAGPEVMTADKAEGKEIIGYLHEDGTYTIAENQVTE